MMYRETILMLLIQHSIYCKQREIITIYLYTIRPKPKNNIIIIAEIALGVRTYYYILGIFRKWCSHSSNQ